MKLENMGIIPYTENYDLSTSTLYVLSSLLKNKDICCNNLSINTDIHIRSIARYKYYSFNRVTNANLNTIQSILDSINYPINLFFDAVNEFIQRKAIAILFNIDNTFISYSELDFEKTKFNICRLKSMLNFRKKILRSNNPKILSSQNIALSHYPASLIKEYKGNLSL